MGHMNILLYLIQHGAGIDTTTVRGETALHLAARANQTDVMRILLRNGAQVDARARVRTLLTRNKKALMQRIGYKPPPDRHFEFCRK